MKITQLAQSGCILETQSGFRLAVDVGSYTPLEELAGVTAHAALVSHFHGDHFSPAQLRALAPQQVYVSQECLDHLDDEALPGEVVIVREGEQLTIGDVTVQVFVVDHGPNATAYPKENFGFLFTADGETVYFAGDMYHPSGIAVTELSVNTVMVPVGGHYTFGPEEAYAFVKQFKSVGQVLPMHDLPQPGSREVFLALLKK